MLIGRVAARKAGIQQFSAAQTQRGIAQGANVTAVTVRGRRG